MSWDSYVDNLVQQSNGPDGQAHCDRALIIGLDGGRWITDNHPRAMKLTNDEIQVIAKAMRSGDFTVAQANGLYLEGQKYQFLREDGSVMYAKKKDHGSVTIQKSKTAIVIGHTAEGKQAGNTNKAVGVIADYLTSVGM